jgi:hypothetical protein
MATQGGVRTTHPEYNAMQDRWQRARDVASGRDAVMAAKTRYLPKLREQPEDSYKAMLMRASFYNASWRTISGLSGMLFSKPMLVEVPTAIEPLLKDVTLSGQPFHLFAEELAKEILTVDRVGVLVDHPAPILVSTAAVEVTKAQAERAGQRPTMAAYTTESIRNWRHRRVGNKWALSMVVLGERHREPDGDFGEMVEDRWRVLDLDERGLYRQRVFRIDKHDKDELVSEVFPLLAGKPMDFIPMYVFGSNGLCISPEVPAMMDLYDLNLDHYRVSADYERGCHLTAIPTPWISGWSPEVGSDGKPTQLLYIGSEAAWVFPNPGAQAQFLEFTGQGLTELQSNLRSKEERMAILGARMLEVQKRDAEAADTAAIHRTGEGSILASIATGMSLALSLALVVFCEWAGSPDPDAKAEVNRDFMPTGMDPTALTALLAAWQAGAISYTTLFNRMKAGQIIDEERTEEEEQGSIEEDPPTPSMIPATADPAMTGGDPAPDGPGKPPKKAA